MAGTKLVIGASGFLGSHVAKQLVARGDDVRVLIRATSSTRGIDGLPVDVRHGDVFDTESLRAAMDGCDVVHYCVVDARPWLRDRTPLWRTNVDGLRNVLGVAVEANLARFVFTSSSAPSVASTERAGDESTATNWLDVGGDYIRSRVAAEDLVLRYCAEKGLPGVAMCVANTFGPGDRPPTPHGGLLAGRGARQDAVLHRRLRRGGRRYRGRGRGDGPRRRARADRRTLHRVRAVHEHPRDP